MKLYHYDHCPYCVKARMIFGLKGIQYELTPLANDDEETPIKMIGQKMLPILEMEKNHFLPESLDIIQFVDSQDNQPIVRSTPVEGEKASFLKSWLPRIREYHYFLAMPRWTQLGLPEFQTESAIAYFRNKKLAFVGSFEKKWEETPQLLETARHHLAELEPFIGEDFVHGDLTLDDFHLFSALRCLTVVRDFHFPKNIEAYTQFIAQKSNVPLHWGLAI